MRWPWALALVAFFALASVPSLPAFAAMSHDSGIFALGGRLLLEGKLPYRDFWDHKPPLIFVYDALGLATGLGRLGLFLVELAALAAGLVAFTAAAWKRLGPVAAASGAVFFALEVRQPGIYQGGNTIEVFCAAIGLGVLAVALARPEKLAPWLVAGLLGGASFMTKQSIVGVPVALGLALGVEAVRGERRRLVVYAAGGAGLVLAIVLGLVATGVFAEGWSANFVYSPLYVSHVSRQEDPELARSAFPLVAWLHAKELLLPCAAVVGCLALLRGPRRELAAIALVGLAADLACAQLPRRYYGHYLVAILPSLSLGVALLAAALEEKRPRLGWLPLLVLGVMPAIGVGRAAVVARRVPAGDPEVLALLARTPADRPVFVWGAQTQYYFLSGRSCPSRYVHLYPLQMPGYGSPARTAELLADLEARPPSVILDASPADVPVPSLREERRAKQRPLSGYEYVAFESVYAWIERRYERAGVVGGWDVYVPRR